MTHLYYGEGKGKTTAAIGLSVRALGIGIPVVFVQFLKGREAGEVKMLENLGATVLRGKAADKFVSAMSDEEKIATKKISDENLSRALSICRKISERNEKVLLVLDEACAAWNFSMADRARIEEIVRMPLKNMELVITGRNPPSFMLECADYATEMRKEKHPFDSGTKARKGVEF